jgi:polyisoprenoid-binding protein YceI
MNLEVRVRADGLELLDDVKPSDRREIEDRMRREVLETTVYPEIVYQGAASADHVEGGRYQVRVDGRLSLHGVTRAHPLTAELLVFGDGIRLRGESSLRLPEYRIRPVTALAGTIKLKDELKLAFDVAALPEGS